MDIKTYNKFTLIGLRCGNINNQVKKFIEDNNLNNYVVKTIINPPIKYNDMLDILNDCEYVVHTYKKINQGNIHFEIIKKYDCNLREFQNKLNETHINEIINYLIFIQIELFDKYGFIWHKLSLSNIIIEKNDELIKNNIELAILHAVILISIAIMLAPALVKIEAQFIPYPKLPF